ncbi:DUF4329 domain-containing protein [Pseudomonas nabeulensis]|uniref:DUF4329 domain-containing protein n=1 Tax=Pseudomonas nabeulensis TaxID=2293833 RepID=A0A4Z0AT33_9PSED|nr:DUF4329 domain-containing protein [Pseudomonas nabeulensis]TFY89966.1 DUF4329 domain-containing protein [Pseudomonas nabeulensis]
MAQDKHPPPNKGTPKAQEAMALEGPFINADDAAFWAHQHIGNKRDVEYGGVILRRHGRFFASVPRRGAARDFKISNAVDVDDEGKLVLPDGYAAYAFYHSHPTPDMTAQSDSVPAEAYSAYIGMFSYADMHLIIEYGSVVPAHYLSGTQDALLKYVTSGSLKERELVVRISPEQRAALNFFLDYIPLVADAGELRVVVANAAWGGAPGRIGNRWRLGVPLSRGTPPPIFKQITTHPGLSDVLALGTAPSFGYQLKAIGKEHYVVPVEAWERRVLTPPEQLFPLRPDGGVRLPSNFRISTLYCRQAPPEAWQHPHFFTPALLAAAAVQLRKSPKLYDSERGLQLVTRTSDGALLSYRFSKTDEEAGFLGADGLAVEAQLKDKSRTGRQFVESMAAIGEVRVLQAGRAWRITGNTLPLEPLLDVLSASMSPAFITADDAARYLHDRIRDRLDDVLGYVLQRSDGTFVSTPPIRESDFSVQLGLRYDGTVGPEPLLPPDYRVAGFFIALTDQFDVVRRNLPAGAGPNRLAPDDEAALYISIPVYAQTASMTARNQKIPALYYSGASGSLVKYVRSGSEREDAFSTLVNEIMRTGMLKLQMDGYDGTPVETVRKLARIGEFSVLVSSEVWRGSQGKVPEDWVPLQPFVAPSPASPAFSWVFQDALTAARYGQDQLEALSGDPRLCFMLKNKDAERYVVACVDANSAGTALPKFSPQRVFSSDANGQLMLPAGYEIHALLYVSRPPLGSKQKQHWLYESFVSPADLALAVAASREPAATIRRFFLSTRDGAQLEYEFSATGLEGQLYGVTPTGAVTDNGLEAALVAGRLTAIEFVRRVAAAGTLSVRRAGTLWDVEGPVDERWQPFARYPVPVFSAPFLSADDAARFAHEQIGSEREAEYCGFILKTLDQRFVATLPMPCRMGDRFAIEGVFATDHTGTLILPQPYVLYGQYASCRAVSLRDSTRMDHYRWSRTEAAVQWQLFTDPELHRLISNRHLIGVAYLSSTEDALLAYDLSGSAAELALLAKLAPGPQGSQLDKQRTRGELRPEAWVRELARTGLRIVLGSRLWGVAGQLPDRWQAMPSAKAFERPEQVSFGAVCSSANEAVMDAHARRARGYESTQIHFSFVLKHEHKDEYVVSQAVPCDNQQPLFNTTSLFATGDDGGALYPPGFQLHGLFYARQWMPESLSKEQRWLASHFISSADLYSAFRTATRWRDEGSVVTLPVFISTLDNALLRFQTPISTRLFDAERHPSGSFQDVHALLASGELTPQAFVRRVASLCWLSVVVPNECWDETGKLSVDWIAYANFSRRALSPAFFSQDDAVRYVRTLIVDLPNQLYGGLVLRRADGLYVATEPLPVTSENFDPKNILPDEDVRQDWLAPGLKLTARYRTRMDRLPDFQLTKEALDVYRNMFTTEVLGKALDCNHLWSHEYLFALDGSVISFTCDDLNRDLLSTAQQLQQALDLQQLKVALAPSAQTPHDPKSNLLQQQLRDGLMSPTAFINQVLKVASMTVVEGSQLWGTAQLLPRGWLPSHGFSAPERSLHVQADRACSPVFSHIDDVARYVHGQAGERLELTFGFLLKSSNKKWMASLPVSGEDLKFSLSKTFSRGQLPLGWTVQGMYLCAPAHQPEELGASEVYRSFIPPGVLRAALWALVRDDQYLPLYVSCADSGLLSYRATAIDSDWSDEHRLQAFVRKLNGPYNPDEYIRQVARSGKLEVLITGEIWATQGVVSSTWVSRRASVYVPGAEERLPLGPFFSHADDAARYPWRRYHSDPNKAWLGAVLSNAAADTFLVTEPVPDNGPIVPVGSRMFTLAYQRLFFGVMNTSVPMSPGRYPEGFNVIGVQQINKRDAARERFDDRYQEALADNFIAQQDFRAFVGMLRQDAVAGARYYFTPRNGALLVYLPSYERSEQEMLLFGWLDPQTDKPRATPSEVISTLATTGHLSILEPDRFWQPRSHVGTQLLQTLRKLPA